MKKLAHGCGILFLAFISIFMRIDSETILNILPSIAVTQTICQYDCMLIGIEMEQI